MKKVGKKYQNALKFVAEKLQDKKNFELKEAVNVLTETSTVKFDPSCEVHINLDIDPKQSDQMVRSTVVLPHGTGKTVKIIAFVPDEVVKEAMQVGVIDAGLDNLIEKINKGWLDFDIAVAHPDAMKSLGKVAKILGPKGLMPNPKAGTVSADIVKIINELKAGKVEFRADKDGNLHNTFGKISFGKEKLFSNVKAYLKAVVDAKPSSLKGSYIRSITFATTMGPGIPVDVSDAMKA